MAMDRCWWRCGLWSRKRSGAKRIAIPGKLTSAYLALKLFEPDFDAVVTPFDKILDAVNERAVDLGLIIHEAQLTYSRTGLHRVLDLGRWWKTKFDLPLPLGANALLRSLPLEVQSECCRLMRESIQYALDHREEALSYALQFARDMDTRLADKFVGMYVNHLHRGLRRHRAPSRAKTARHGLRGGTDSAARGSGVRPVASTVLDRQACLSYIESWAIARQSLSPPHSCSLRSPFPRKKRCVPKDVRNLAKQGSSALPRLQELLRNPDLDIRLEAVKAITDIGTQGSLAPLIQATADNDPEVQIRATDGLVNFYLPGYVQTWTGRVHQARGHEPQREIHRYE